MPAPLLLLTSPDEDHVFDRYMDEILLTEGYNVREHRQVQEQISAQDLEPYALVIISAGAARQIAPEVAREYMEAGGRLIVVKPPLEWAAMFGLTPRGETYATVANGYIQLNFQHPWLRDFAALDLQCHGEMYVCENQSAEVLALIAGQLGLPSEYPAVAAKSIGEGAGAIFCYDLADTIVRFHQGDPANASDGVNPDANRDGKFTGDDLFEGMRDYELRHVPQADVHQDLLVRVIAGLTRDVAPLPRLWHFPNGAPSLVLIDGDSDGMDREDLLATIEACERYGAKYTAFLMTTEIEALDPEELAQLRQRGHAFGPHPWVSFKPAAEEWQAEISGIVANMKDTLGIEPSTFRSHSCIFPGWDASPTICAESGLRFDTNFTNGYRYQSGYANGSALPVKFIDRAGQIIDCYEQCTVHGDDILRTPKCMLPAYSEGQCIELSLATMAELAERYHGVYHPYFHPIYVGPRGRFPTKGWLEAVLAEMQRRRLPCPNDEQWLAFNDARRAIEFGAFSWDAASGDLSFIANCPAPVEGITVMLPGNGVSSVRVGGQAIATECVMYEGIPWTMFKLDVAAGDEVAVTARTDRG